MNYENCSGEKSHPANSHENVNKPLKILAQMIAEYTNRKDSSQKNLEKQDLKQGIGKNQKIS